MALREGLEPTHGLSNSQVPYQFGYLRMVGVVRIELTCTCPQGRRETTSRHSAAHRIVKELQIKWGDRRESNSRGLVHSQPPEPLGYGHIWWRTGESNPDWMVAGHRCSRYH